MDEASLIHFAQKGDLDAFNRLVLAYQDLVYNQAYRMIGEFNAASDVAQDAFILAYRKLRDYRGGSFKAWLLRIVTNVSYDELRRRQRHPTNSLEPMNDSGEEVETPGWIVDPGETPDERLERAELNQSIQHCLEDLPDDFRAAIILIDVQGMDYIEAAQAVSTPVGTVKSRVARARLKLRECLQGFWELIPAVFRLQEESE